MQSGILGYAHRCREKHVEAEKHADLEWHTGYAHRCRERHIDVFNKALVENSVNAGKRIKGS
jgi:hypothetical protein